jgi:hypothetical protein
MNSNFKRSFEPYAFTQYNPIKKLRLENGQERAEYLSIRFSPSKPCVSSTQSVGSTSSPFGTPSQERRAIFKAHHKCKPVPEPPPKPNFQFKARPMPNFSNPFVPKLFKHSTTSFQEFNLTCYRSASKASTASRCDTPDSQFTNSFLTQKNDSPKKFEFKARPMPDFSKAGASGKKGREEGMMDLDGQGMDLDGNL